MASPLVEMTEEALAAPPSGSLQPAAPERTPSLAEAAPKMRQLASTPAAKSIEVQAQPDAPSTPEVEPIPAGAPHDALREPAVPAVDLQPREGHAFADAPSGPPVGPTEAAPTRGPAAQIAASSASVPVASLPVILPTPDPRGRVVSARLVVADGVEGSSVRIDLEPADLGRVEVALRLDDDGVASASFTVDRPETLQLLQRDARSVGELLNAAGFNVQQGALGFSLRDPPNGQQGPERGPRTTGRANTGDPAIAAGAAPTAYRRGLLDLRV